MTALTQTACQNCPGLMTNCAVAAAAKGARLPVYLNGSSYKAQDVPSAACQIAHAATG